MSDKKEAKPAIRRERAGFLAAAMAPFRAGALVSLYILSQLWPMH